MAKQLRYEERNAIETDLNKGVCIQRIAARLSRDRKTISEEIRRNGQWVEEKCYGRKLTRCEHHWKKECTESNLCHETLCNHKKLRNRCWSCSQCEVVCPKFKPAECEQLRRSPYCCNGCKDRPSCNISKFLYLAGNANVMAAERKSLARKGCSYSHAQLRHMSRLLQEGSKKGQSFHHIYVSNRDDFFCSERNLYLLKDSGILDVKNLDMPATVQRKLHKKRHREEHKVDKYCREGRSYEDYQAYLAHNIGIMPVQMDVVEGIKDDLKCFLSLSWPHLQLSLYFLMKRQTALCVEATMTYLYERLGMELFAMMFPLILTDNGSEFSNPTALESLSTRIFYCDPRASHQKANVENQNGQLRRIIPKGYSMENLDFEDSFLINANLNSYVRLSVNDKTPFQMLKTLYPPKVIEALQLYEVAPNNVVLKPSLLKGKLERK